MNNNDTLLDDLPWSKLIFYNIYYIFEIICIKFYLFYFYLFLLKKIF